MEEAAYRAARRSAVLAEPELGVLSFKGPDRQRFLQGLMSNDVASMAAGGALKTCVLTPKGKLVGDLWLYELGSQFLTLQRPAATKPVMDALSKPLILSDTVMEDSSVRWRKYFIGGPKAAEIAHACGRAAAHVLDYPDFGLSGKVLLGDEALGKALESALTDHGGMAAGTEALETLRVEAGIPAFGVDADAETLPLEANLESAISFTKGCYMGQETTARIKNFGHVNRGLAGLRLSRHVAAGSAVFMGGKEVGRVTSVVDSPKLGGPLALAMLRREAIEARTRLQAGVRETMADAELVELPLGAN